MNNGKDTDTMKKSVRHPFARILWAIVGTYFVAFNTFPINMIAQYLKLGKWKDYLYGERFYIILSLAAKSVLAWLVLFGAMQP